MYGTLRGALAARHITIDVDKYKATVEGRIEGEGRAIRITEIAVHYDLTIPTGTRKEADRALEVHPQGCPAHQSVKDAIKVTWTADIKEE
ncbi:MAG: OsmC family protein [Chloroflexi bacterium]|nr:OsmC family protein [Chloroflexota bacterium]MCZ6891866.1 OsmC family protein [Chloroflexota bacterium]